MDTASLRIAINTGDVKTANTELDKLTKTSARTEKATDGVSSSFISLNKVLAVGAVSGMAFQFIKLADTITGMESKLKLVTSSTQELITAQSELFKIAQTTRQGFAETVNTYSNFALAMGEMGKSQKEILRVTETVNKAIAISGGTAQMAAAATMQLGQAFASGTLRGDELNSILENSKGLAQAIADGMGVPIGKLRTLGSEGKITAEILVTALEKSAQSVDDKFSKVGVTVEQSMTMVTNSLLNAVGEMDNATGASSALAGSMSALSSVFTSAANSLHNFNIEIDRLQDVRKIKTFDDVNISLKQIDEEIKSLTTSMDLSDRVKRTLMGEVNVRAKLIQLRASEAALNKKVNVIAEDELKIQNKKDEAYKNRPAKSLTKEEISAAKKAAKEAEILAEEEAKIQRGYLEGYAELQAQQAIDQYELELSQIEDLAKRQSDSATSLYEMTLSDTDKLNAKFMEINETSAQFFDEETLTKFYSKWQEEIEKVQDNLDFKIKIDFDTEGDFKGVSKIAKQMELLADETKQYEENKKKAGKNTDLLAKAEEDHTQNQIAGYANIAGAMSSMFEQGSREAAAFQAIESGLAVVAGVRAIMTAGTGDPYTAIPRMVAMAAMVAQTLQSANIAFGGGGSISTSSDAFSAMASNEGKGSVLGDATAQSESITKSLELMSDLAKPEFALMSQMTSYLESIDQKLGGVSSLLVQSGGFALGEGYQGFDISSSMGDKVVGFYEDTLGKIVDKTLKGDKLTQSLMGATVGIIGKVASGIFGKTSVSQTMTDSGIYFADALLKNAVEDFNGSAYQTISTTVSKKSWFKKSSSTSVATYFQGLDDEVERQFSLVLSDLYNTTLLAGQALDTSASSIEDDLSDFVVSIGKISLKGKTGDEIQETISAIFGKISDDIALDVFPLLTSFQQVGEGLFETMTRVASGMEEAEYYINRLGLSFNDVVYSDLVNKQGDVALEALRQSILALEGTSGGVSEIIQSLNGDAEELFATYSSLDRLRFSLTAIGTNIVGLTSSMLYGAGGISALDDATQSYIENYLTESEQVAYNTSVMTDAFSDLGLTIPTTKQGFTDLLKSIDVTTESGQDLYGRLILLSEGFNDLVESSDKIKSSLFDNIQKFIDSISIKNTSDAPKAFIDFSTSFNSMIDAIANGSSDLLEVGNTALDNAQNYLNVVTATATAGRDVEFAKAMLVNKFSDVIAAPDTSLNTINNTLIANNQALIAELKFSRDEMVKIRQSMDSSNNYQKNIERNTQTSRFVGA